MITHCISVVYNLYTTRKNKNFDTVLYQSLSYNLVAVARNDTIGHLTKSGPLPSNIIESY